MQSVGRMCSGQLTGSGAGRSVAGPEKVGEVESRSAEYSAAEDRTGRMQSVGRAQRSDVNGVERGVSQSWAAAARPLSAKLQPPAAQPLRAFRSTWLPLVPAVLSP